jgi:hypothetical protein
VRRRQRSWTAGERAFEATARRSGTSALSRSAPRRWPSAKLRLLPAQAAKRAPVLRNGSWRPAVGTGLTRANCRRWCSRSRTRWARLPGSPLRNVRPRPLVDANLAKGGMYRIGAEKSVCIGRHLVQRALDAQRAFMSDPAGSGSDAPTLPNVPCARAQDGLAFSFQYAPCWRRPEVEPVLRVVPK